MKYLGAILKSAISIPLVVILLGVGGLILAIPSTLILGDASPFDATEIAGATVAWLLISIVFSSLPTIIFGWPICACLGYFKSLTRNWILGVSALFGGSFLSSAYSLSVYEFDDLGWWFSFVLGAIAGIFNGSVCLRFLNLTKR